MNSEKEVFFKEYVKDFMKLHHAEGMAISAINSQGETIYEDFFGYRDTEKEKEINDETIFGIASMTKSFTALAIMQLVEKGVVKITDSISEYLPHFKAGDREDVTVEHLLTHSAGYYPMERMLINDLKDGFDLENNDPSTYIPFLEEASQKIEERLMAVEDRMKASEYCSYSNDGFALLSEIVRLHGGEETYEEYLEKHICKPLGMERTSTLFNEIEKDENLSKRYSPDEEGDGYRGDYDLYDNAFALPGEGNIKSTLADMKKYIHFYLTQGSKTDILDAYYIKEMMKPRILYGYQDYYAYGLSTRFMDDLKLVGHGGSLPGVSSNMTWSEEADLAIVVLCNTRAVPVKVVAERLMKLIHQPDFKEGAYGDLVHYGSVKWTDEFIDKATGTYISPEKSTLEIYKKDNDIILAIDGEENIMNTVSPRAGIIEVKENQVYIELFIENGIVWGIRYGGRIIKKS